MVDEAPVTAPSSFVRDGALAELGGTLLRRIVDVSFRDAEEALGVLCARLEEDEREALHSLLGREGAERWLIELASLCFRARLARQEGSHGP